jgi:hypothetical protein
VLTGPQEAVDIDLATGAQHESDLVPEAYQVGCPRSSPDGTALLFTTTQNRGASLQIMLSRRSDGRDAESLIPGSVPVWLPKGGEFIFSFDSRHLAAMTLTAKRPVLFPEVPPDHRQFMDATATHLGKAIAAVYSDGTGGSFVDLNDYPSLALLEAVHSKSAITTLTIAPRARGLGLTMLDPRNVTLGSLADDGSLRRWNKVEGLNVGWTALMEPALVFTTYMNTTSVVVRDRRGAERTAVVDQIAYSPTVSDDGAVAVQTVLPDGRSVIALASDDGQLRPVTAGPVDVLPRFIPGRKAFVHTDVSHNALVVCTLGLADTASCKAIRTEPLRPVAPLPSPDGSQIAYLTEGGVQRARIIGVDGTLARDLPGFHTDCLLRWASNKTLWAFHRAESRWVEVDTGRTIVVDNVDNACDQPPVTEEAARNPPPFTARTVWHKHATVRVVDGFVQSNADF